MQSTTRRLSLEAGGAFPCLTDDLSDDLSDEDLSSISPPWLIWSRQRAFIQQQIE